jgi:hypothetical protein
MMNVFRKPLPVRGFFNPQRRLIMLKIAQYCRAESRKAGTSPNQYKAAMKLVEEAMRDTQRVDVRPIEVTKDAHYGVWMRLKLKNAPAVSYRAIIEITDQEVIVQVILPRSSATYDEVRKLWQQHRTHLVSRNATV